MEKIIDTCALCKQKAELRESHIIPNWIHLKIFKTEGKGIYRVDGKNIITQKQLGYVKEHLLCGHCEQNISGWENYIKNYMSPTKGNNFKKIGATVSRDSLEGYIFNGVDSKKIWFCLTSIIYRMSISKSILYKNMHMNGYNKENLRYSLSQSHVIDNFIVFGAYKKIKCLPDSDGVSPLGSMSYKIITENRLENPVWVIDIAGWVFYIEELNSPRSEKKQISILDFENETFKIKFYGFMDKKVFHSENNDIVLELLPIVPHYTSMNLEEVRKLILNSGFNKCPCDNPDVRLKRECCALYFNIK